jgi:general stress protein 26
MQTHTNDHAEMDSSYDKLWEIVKDCRFAMLTTVEQDGTLRARPMTTVQKEFGGTLWFIAPAESDAVTAVAVNEQVNVAYADTDKADFVSVSGTASVVSNIAIKEKLWSPMAQAWFPQGPSSPDVVVLKIDATQAEYWDSKNNKLLRLFSMAGALARGTQPKDIGEHRAVKLPRH